MKRKKNKICPLQIALVLLFSILLAISFFLPKGSLEIWTNQFHHPISDLFFATWTHLGDGILFLWIIPLLAVKRLSFGIFVTFSALIQALVIAICKRGIFKAWPRPAEYLKDLDFYQIPGVSLHHWNSFPSGHTATAMGIASCLMIIYYKNINLRIAFLITGLLVAFSRVYLMQHFYMDILAGTLVGLGCTWIARELTLRYFSKKQFRKSMFKRKKSRIKFKKLRSQLLEKEQVAA
jgi:membrane-associated phospholipid phosphatase